MEVWRSAVEQLIHDSAQVLLLGRAAVGITSAMAEH
jgi:hypothetical protein